ncbi:uncharacterized protein LOC111496915 isoform X2 [Cucurbita maxima]|uniref:Uncharacterized protein LOC111496915 isoform X2 n=1 Tax=Cucurbita maxima TaxID=3661 RepID=A0A6J1KR90_CUCMA|nr:uncharacterized protein LOC111496915 isoform X2 [Cucurbita maxima]
MSNTMTTELHSTYWLDRYADESDSFQNVKDEYISSTSWHRALQIPDSSVTMDDENHLFAEVLSQKDRSVSHIVWNPGSEFSFCACSWSMQGNLCKHVIKIRSHGGTARVLSLRFRSGSKIEARHTHFHVQKTLITAMDCQLGVRKSHLIHTLTTIPYPIPSQTSFIYQIPS